MFQGYDGQFILSWLEDNAHKPDLILRGRKIMKLQCNMVTVSDSMNFLPFPLASLPKAFGFSEEKGFFPFLFNTKTNENYVGTYPDAKYYCPERMKDSSSFEKWYNSVKHQEFNMREQLISYCTQDVEVLKQG